MVRGCQVRKGWVCSALSHALRFVHVPRPPPLALGVLVTRHALPVDALPVALPAQVLLQLLRGGGHGEVRARRRGLALLEVGDRGKGLSCASRPHVGYCQVWLGNDV